MASRKEPDKPELYEFYRKVLETLDYSVTGYSDSTERIEKFIVELCADRGVASNWKLKFLSYAMARLVDAIEFRTRPLSKEYIFYHSFHADVDEPLLMHDYYLFKDWLALNVNVPCATCASDPTGPCNPAKTGEDKAGLSGESSDQVKTASVISRLFVNATSFRVSCEDVHQVGVAWDAKTDCIAITVPPKALFSSAGSSITDLRNTVHDKYASAHSQAASRDLRLTKERSIYRYNRESKISSFIHSELDEDKIRALHAALNQKLLALNKQHENHFFGLVDDCRKAEEERWVTGRHNGLNLFSKLIISQALSSFLFKVVVENIPTVVNVDATTKHRQSLGTMVVGYDKADAPSDYVRACLKLVTERISQVLAAEALYELSLPLRVKHRRSKQFKILQQFSKTVLHQTSADKKRLDHAAIPVDDTSLKNLASFKVNYPDELLNEELPDFRHFLQQHFIKDRHVDRGLFTHLHGSTHKEHESLPVLGKVSSLLKIGAREDPVVNIAFVHACVAALLKKGGTVASAYVNPSPPSDVLEVKVNGLTGFKLSELISSIEGRTESNNGDFGGFLALSYLDILAIGNLELSCTPKGGCAPDSCRLNFGTDFVFDVTQAGKAHKCKLSKPCACDHTEVTLLFKFDDL